MTHLRMSQLSFAKAQDYSGTWEWFVMLQRLRCRDGVFEKLQGLQHSDEMLALYI